MEINGSRQSGPDPKFLRSLLLGEPRTVSPWKPTEIFFYVSRQAGLDLIFIKQVGSSQLSSEPQTVSILKLIA